MTHALSAVLAASTVKSIGAVIAVLVGIGFVVYVVVNIRAGRAEVASEIELAPNRKPYFDDEEMEGRKLERSLSAGLLLLGVVAIGLPLYWLNEPGRMDGAEETFDEIFVHRGEALFAPTEEGGYDCAGCHGPEGVGGVAPYTITDDEGEFVATVPWKAPALDTVLLRYSEEEVREVLVFGRPGTPMPAWGEEGGGPLTTQQIDELIAYLYSIKISPEEAQAEAEAQLRKELGLGEDESIDYRDPAVGQTLFNLGLEDGFAGGAYSCGRCHTKGAAFVHGPVEPENADLSEHAGFPDGSGAFGFNLRNALVPRQFLSLEELVEFVTLGSEHGILYGQRGQGTGRMPAFGDDPDDEDDPNDDGEGDGMLTEEMIEAIARYEESFPDDRAGEGEAEDGDTADTTTTSTPTAVPGGTTSTTLEP